MSDETEEMEEVERWRLAPSEGFMTVLDGTDPSSGVLRIEEMDSSFGKVQANGRLAERGTPADTFLWLSLNRVEVREAPWRIR